MFVSYSNLLSNFFGILSILINAINTCKLFSVRVYYRSGSKEVEGCFLFKSFFNVKSKRFNVLNLNFLSKRFFTQKWGGG